MVDDIFCLPKARRPTELSNSGIVANCNLNDDSECNRETRLHEQTLIDDTDNESLSISISEGCSEIDSCGDIVYDLKEVVNDMNISQNDLTKLLHVLNKYHPELPLDARTLLNTPRGNDNIQLRHVSPGDYFHFGLKKGLLFVTKELKIRDDTLFIQINCDGLPIHRSTTESFWPILGSLHGYPKSIFW